MVKRFVYFGHIMQQAIDDQACKPNQTMPSGALMPGFVRQYTTKDIIYALELYSSQEVTNKCDAFMETATELMDDNADDDR